MADDSYMMKTPLITSYIIEYAEQVYPKVEVFSRENNDCVEQTCYGEIAIRSRKVADSFLKMGLKQGDCVGGFAWSTRRYLELFYSVPGMGGMLHTINPRLHSEDLIYIINHAANRALCIDRFTWQAVADISEDLTTVEYYVWLDDVEHIPAQHPFKNLFAYDHLVESGSADFQWPSLDEDSPCTVCYTSGTTGKPKGVVYTHRGNVLMMLSSASKGFFGYPQTDGQSLSFLSLTGMFHGNAWMMPFAAPFLGAKLALVGRDYDPAKLCELIDVARVSLAAGVPTILQSMLDYVLRENKDFGSLKKVVLAGSRPSIALIDALENQFGLDVAQAWGMTEAQMGSMPVLGSEYAHLSHEEKIKKKYRGGLANFGMKMRLIDDDNGVVPFDGVTSGHLLVKGPWVISKYLNHGDEERSGYMTEDGWFRTGDIACIHPDGCLEIVDRSKDLIKSGGEWIGPAIIESVVSSHPGIQESAVIGIPHPKWQERPMLLAVRIAGSNIDEAGLRDYLTGKVARWWVPENVLFVDSLPRTGTGKINKKMLKDKYSRFQGER